MNHTSPPKVRRRGVVSLAVAAVSLTLATMLPATSAIAATPVQPGAQALAQQLVASGRLSGEVEPIAQIQAYAGGTMRSHVINGASRDCYISTPILNALKIVIVDRGFSLRVSSLNRYCINQLTGSGSSSYHWRNGGGNAVDINRVNGVQSTGNTTQDRALIQSMYTALPAPAGLGQLNCHGFLSVPSGWVQFDDACNHNHFEYRGSDTSPPGLPVSANDAPTSIIDGNDRISLYSIRSDGNLYGTSQASAGGSFGGWQLLGSSVGTLVGRPAVLQHSTGVVAIYARTAQGTVVGTNQVAPGGSFTAWTAIGTNGAGVASDPATVEFNNGAIGVYAATTAGTVSGTSQGGPGGAFGSWGAVGALSAPLSGRPAIVHLPDDRVVLFAKSADGYIHQSAQIAPGGGFAAWAVLGSGGAGINSEPVAVVDQGRITVFAAAGSTVSSVTQDTAGGNFLAWVNLGSGPSTLASNTPFAIAGGGYHSVYSIGADQRIWGTSVLSPPSAPTSWSQIGSGATLSTVPVGIRTSSGVNCIYAASSGSVVGTCQSGQGGSFGTWSTM